MQTLDGEKKKQFYDGSKKGNKVMRMRDRKMRNTTNQLIEEVRKERQVFQRQEVMKGGADEMEKEGGQLKSDGGLELTRWKIWGINKQRKRGRKIY